MKIYNYNIVKLHMIMIDVMNVKINTQLLMVNVYNKIYLIVLNIIKIMKLINKNVYSVKIHIYYKIINVYKEI